MKSKIILTAHPAPVIPKPGIYPEISMDEYNRWDAFRKSYLSAALKSGEHLRYKIENPESTPALTLGGLVDCLLLEPSEYANRYIVRPSTYNKEITKGRGMAKITKIETKPWNNNSNICRAIQRELVSSGKTIIEETMLKKANAITIAIRTHPLADEIIQRCEKQVCVAWNDPNTGIICKGRLDLYDQKNRKIWDIKTSADASPGEFPRMLTKFNYHAQGGAYCMGAKVLTGQSHKFGLIVVETGEQTEIPQVVIYKVGLDSLMAGYVKLWRALKNVAVWQQSGFAGYSRFVEPIEASNWEIERELTQWEGELEL